MWIRESVFEKSINFRYKFVYSSSSVVRFTGRDKNWNRKILIKLNIN